MTKSQKRKLIDAVRTGSLLDWGYSEDARSLDSDDLRSIIRELGYAIYATRSNEARDAAISNIQDNIDAD